MEVNVVPSILVGQKNRKCRQAVYCEWSYRSRTFIHLIVTSVCQNKMNTPWTQQIRWCDIHIYTIIVTVSLQSTHTLFYFFYFQNWTVWIRESDAKPKNRWAKTSDWPSKYNTFHHWIDIAFLVDNLKFIMISRDDNIRRSLFPTRRNRTFLVCQYGSSWYARNVNAVYGNHCTLLEISIWTWDFRWT